MRRACFRAKAIAGEGVAHGTSPWMPWPSWSVGARLTQRQNDSIGAFGGDRRSVGASGMESVLVRYERERLIELLQRDALKRGRSPWPAAGRRITTWTAAR